MLLAYLLFFIGILWLIQILLQGQLHVTLPKIKWHLTNSLPQPLTAPQQQTSVDQEDILGPSRGPFTRPSVATNLEAERRMDIDTRVVGNGLLEDTSLGEENTSNEFTYFPSAHISQRQSYSFGKVEEVLEDSDEIDDDVDPEEEVDPSEHQLVIHTFSDQLTAYPAEESQTQPDHFEIPLSDLEEGENEPEVETISLDELMSEETSSSDVPLDKYFSQLQTVESILEDIRKSIRRKQARQTVDQLCRQFTDVLGYYSMINDKNVLTRVNQVLKANEAPDYAREFMRLQRESLGLEGEEVINEEFVEECA